MPYIKPEDRERMSVMDVCRAGTPGELNYQITKLCLGYIARRFDVEGIKLNYQAINDIVGALEGAKLEFYRRVAAPYEDTKIKENGDVY
jgi:hypothetical protein